MIPQMFIEDCFEKLGFGGHKKPSVMTIPHGELHRLFSDIAAQLAMYQRLHSEKISREALLTGVRADAADAMRQAVSEALQGLDMTAVADRVERLAGMTREERDADTAQRYLAEGNKKRANTNG